MAKRPIVLVGLPGAGKTTVGRLVAERLGAPFADFDRLIEDRIGKSVARIFSEDGEGVFRDLEAAIGAEQLAAEPSVLSPGGGYVLDERSRLLALQLALVVYLETSPAAAAQRLAGQADRPLLRGFEPTLRLRQLMEQRESVYLQAQSRVTTDGRTPEEVADVVAELARAQGGW